MPNGEDALTYLLENADWSFPVPIRYGPGRLAEITAICRENGFSNPLIVTDRGSRDLHFVSKTVNCLQDDGISNAVFSDIAPNPLDTDIAAGREVFRSGGHDAVIAIGGGSGMDGGTAISLVAGNDIDLWAFEFERTPPELNGSGGLVPVICIPTTAGTGTETESTAMVTHTERGIKGCVWHPEQKPMMAILDPELTVGLPSELTAWTGLDALCHAIEAYCVDMWHPQCDGIALEAMRLIARWLRVAVEEPDNVEARGAMLSGSCLAGVSFLKGLGLVHSISHMVGAEFDTHHGLTNAILLPAVLRYNRDAIAAKTPAMCRALGASGDDFGALINWVEQLLEDLQIPRGLGEIGVTDDRAGEIAVKAMGDAATETNPAPATVADIDALLRRAIVAAR